MDAKNTTRIRHTRTKAIHTNGACILIVIVLNGAHVTYTFTHARFQVGSSYVEKYNDNDDD